MKLAQWKGMWFLANENVERGRVYMSCGRKMPCPLHRENELTNYGWIPLDDDLTLFAEARWHGFRVSYDRWSDDTPEPVILCSIGSTPDGRISELLHRAGYSELLAELRHRGLTNFNGAPPELKAELEDTLKVAETFGRYLQQHGWRYDYDYSAYAKHCHINELELLIDPAK